MLLFGALVGSARLRAPRWVGWWIAGAGVVACAGQIAAPDTQVVPPNTALAFVDVNVLPMVENTVLSHRTVLVRGGMIEWIRATGAELPPDAVIIQGRGRYLIPGLIDMHVHLRRADMPLYRAAGITTVRNMWGHPGITQLMDEYAEGKFPGPAIVSASPGIDAEPVQWPFTRVVADPSQARATIHELAGAGWAFIKMYTNVSPEVYDSITAAARSLGLRVVGHVPLRVPVEHALVGGLSSIEHLTGYDRAFSVTNNGGTFGWANADTTRYDRLIGMTVSQQVWNCPTMAIYAQLAQQHSPQDRERIIRNRRAFVRRLAAAGGRIIAGTDAGIDVVPAGLTLQAELEELVAAGLSPYSALRAATVDAGRFLGRNDIGSIQAGGRADLILLNANPLQDVSATRDLAGVVFGGAWYSVSALRSQVSESQP